MFVSTKKTVSRVVERTASVLHVITNYHLLYDIVRALSLSLYVSMFHRIYVSFTWLTCCTRGSGSTWMVRTYNIKNSPGGWDITKCGRLS